MACSTDFIDFICLQLQGVGDIRSRKMFGDWMIYVNEKPLILCCDDIAYVKKHPAILEKMQNAECGFPYPGAKEYFILDVEHQNDLQQIIRVLESVTPVPQKRK